MVLTTGIVVIAAKKIMDMALIVNQVMFRTEEETIEHIALVDSKCILLKLVAQGIQRLVIQHVQLQDHVNAAKQ